VASIESKLRAAAESLCAAQPNLFGFTAATRQSEWNIAAHYAEEVAALFPGYDMDRDVIKHRMRKKRPDIIIHSRGTHARNYLVIEVKRHKKDVAAEKEKIRTTWFRAPLKYRYGAVVVLNGTGPADVTVMRNTAVVVRPAARQR
jgi:hypothetical protein